MIAFRVRDVRPILFRVIGPSDTAPPLRQPGVGVVAAIIGPPGPAGGAAFQHVQSSPSAEWIVNHNLGVRPLATVLSPGGVEVEAGVIHVSTNQLRVLFHTPQGGSCRCV